MATRTEFTLWLTPREPLRSLLRSTIRQLAARFDAVEFEPHVTVFSAPSTDIEARAVARRIAAQFSPIELTADCLDHSESYTKTLFVQFQELRPPPTDLRHRGRAIFQSIELHPEPASQFDL